MYTSNYFSGTRDNVSQEGTAGKDFPVLRNSRSRYVERNNNNDEVLSMVTMQCNQVCHRGPSLALYCLFYMLMTFTLLYIILNMVCSRMICPSTRKCQLQLTVPSCNKILMVLSVDPGKGNSS